MTAVRRYFQSEALRRQMREWDEARRAIEMASRMVEDAMGEALGQADSEMGRGDIEAEKACRIRAQAFREALSYLGAVDVRYWPHNREPPEGWQRTASLADCHHGEYAEIIVPQGGKPKPSIVERLMAWLR